MHTLPSDAVADNLQSHVNLQVDYVAMELIFEYVARSGMDVGIRRPVRSHDVRSTGYTGRVHVGTLFFKYSACGPLRNPVGTQCQRGYSASNQPLANSRFHVADSECIDR
jgi:hypothetical protein